jgi:DNA-binding GntR family transcriptional regulator
MSNMIDKPPLLKDQAYQRLKAMLLDNVFPPGTFLSERQLAAHLDMSKTPIRSALERLAADGFVTVSPQQGIVVRELALKEIVDHYDIRLALEPFVTDRLAGRLLPPQIAQLQANLDAQAAQIAQADTAAYNALDGDFHLLLCALLGNAEITRVMQHQRDKLHRVIAHILQRDPQRMHASHAEHSAVLAALAAGDGLAAAAAMRQHLENGKLFLVA